MKPQYLFRSTVLATIAIGLAAPAAMAGIAPVPSAALNSALADRVAPLHAIAYSPTVLQIQLELNRQGYAAGPADGLIGARTRAAIAAYQQRNGLPVTAQPSVNLLDHIRGSARGATATPAADNSEVRDIRDIQRALERLGYDVQVTGSVDARTRAAIRDYERDNDLLVTGNANQALRAHLRDNLRDSRQDRRDDETDVTAATLAEIQRGLRQRGYDIDAASGRMDDKTTAAIRAYQRDSGLRETGLADQNLADALQVGLPPPAASPANIRAVQSALNTRGFSAGPADGVMGPATRNAIQQYRTSSGLSATGGMDHDLLAALGIAAAAATTTTVTTTGAGAATGAAPSSASPEYVLRWGDDFNDGNYQSNPRWNVIAGEFQVVNGALQSNVDIGGQQTQEQMGREVITGVIGQVFGMQTGAGASRTAAISQDTSFSNAFRISLRIAGTPGGSNAQMNFGPYQGRNVVNGYRLVYDAGSTRPLSIVASTESGVRTAVSSSSAPNLADGQWHKVVWSRDSTGQMLVTIDDRPYMSVVDLGLEGSNTGFSFVNQSGSWRIDDIAVETP